MNVSKTELYRIILEEYAREEGAELSEDRVDDLLAWIKGGPKPKDLDYDKATPPAPEVPEKEDSETFIMDAPAGGDMSDEEIVASISQMIQGRDPEHVSELFQAVFAQIPGVEMGDAEEERPPTLYAPGAEGRPVAGFEIKELMDLIREVLNESAPFHDLTNEYPEGFVSLEREMAQEIWDAGGRMTSVDSQNTDPTPETEEAIRMKVAEYLEGAREDGYAYTQFGGPDPEELELDIADELWKIQDAHENV